MKGLAACAALWALSGGGVPARAAGDFHEALAPHFLVRHEATFMPPGFLMGLERMHGRLRLDLAMFAPWMAKERITLYLYKSTASYAAGEFSPPAWSEGIAIFAKRTVAAPTKPDREALIGTIAHETTHLLFDSYWKEANKRPPPWLDEGLATMEEAEGPGKAVRSVWYQEMVLLAERGTLAMPGFLAFKPAEDKGATDEQLRSWYAQAYAIVTYLYRKHSRLQFKSFVSYLRDGKPIEEALWLAYRYQGLAKFEAAWLAWVRSPSHRKALEAEAAAGTLEEKPQPFAEGIGRIKDFKPLR